MRTQLFTCLYFFSAYSAICQEEIPSRNEGKSVGVNAAENQYPVTVSSRLDYADSSTIYLFPDVEATFPGGNGELLSYISKNINYPEVDVTDFNGKIYLEFVVERNGEVSNVQIVRGGSLEFDKMATELIRKMPNWNPALINGKPVRSKVRLPIFICFH